MKRFRTIVFWVHLAAGVTAGLVILVMSVTGALLALKPQVLSLVESDVRVVTPPVSSAPRLGVQQLLAGVRAARPDAQPTTITLLADRQASAAIALGREGTMYVDPYTGRLLGDGSKRTQLFFRAVEDWHRWLSVSTERRATARSITGASNLAFFLLALSGPYLWWPRSWTWANLRGIVWFRRARTSRARDFNWHNAIGLWCAPVLLVLTLTGVVMSYSGANELLYRLAGSPPPIAGGGGAAVPERGREGRAASAPLDLDGAWARAEAQAPSWRSIVMRLPARSGAPVTFTIVDGQSWNAFARSQLTVNAATASVVKWEPYDGVSRGQKWRGWVRFGHTGELAGLPGQIIAGIACLGASVLVWTGLALAFRRFMNWRRLFMRSNDVAA